MQAVGVVGGLDGIEGVVSGEKTYVGDELGVRRDNMRVEAVTCAGKGTIHAGANWDYFQKALHYCVADRLMLDPKEHPILFSEPNLPSRSSRLSLTELLFEQFQVPSLYLVKSSVLSTFACGRSTALVLDSGAYTTCAVPVCEGLAVTKSLARSEVAGETLTDLVLADITTRKRIDIRPRYSFKKAARCYIDKTGELQIDPRTVVTPISQAKTHESYHRFAVKEIARDVKETVCKVADTPYSEGTYRNVPGVVYEMPDGKEVEMGEERFGITEVVFAGNAVA